MMLFAEQSIFSQSSLLYDTMVSTLWMAVENDRRRTSWELAMICGPDSSHISGTSRSLFVYINRSKAPCKRTQKHFNLNFKQLKWLN